MDTNERNAQIAIMLGWEYISKTHSVVSYQNYGWWVKGTYHPDNNIVDNANWKGFNSHLKFHEDWNKLMDAKLFIESNGYQLDFGRRIMHQPIDGNIKDTWVTIWDDAHKTKVIEVTRLDQTEAVFCAISDFAAFFNGNKGNKPFINTWIIYPR